MKQDTDNKCDLVCGSQPNYESEYYRLTKEIIKLSEENESLKKAILGMCKTMFEKRG